MTTAFKVVAGAIATIVVIVLLIGLFTFRGYSVPSDMVAVHVGAGPFEASKVKGDCIPSSTRGFLTNDDYVLYPTSEREWDATGQEGSDAKPFESVTKDKVIMKVPITIRFSLITECATLKEFYTKYGRRYGVEFKSDGTFEETDANYNQKWLDVLRKLVADPSDATLDRIIQDYNWRDVWNDPQTKVAIEQALTKQLQNPNSLLVQTAHKSYFDGITVLVGKPIPPKELASAVASEQTKVAEAQAAEAQAKADKAKAEAQTAVAKAEAAKQQAVIEGYNGIENYLKHECIEAGCNPFQPSYGAPLTSVK